jgi:signal peptide peptidase SppA
LEFKKIYKLWRRWCCLALAVLVAIIIAGLIKMRKIMKMHFKKNKANVIAELTTKRLTNIPMLICPQNLNAILSVINGPLGKKLSFPDEELETYRQAKQHNESIRYGSIAMISIQGILHYHSNLIDLIIDYILGGTSYDSIREEFQAALADPSVGAIVFDIDSPGGEVSGCFDLVDEIFNARGIKPISAIVNEMAYSAAYAIASAADKVILPRTGGVGSVGVICVHMDQSQYDANVGVKFTPIFAGSHKGDFTPHAPLSTAAQITAQNEIERIYDLFVKTVARNRGIDPKVVRDTQAGLFFGKNAVAVGLADSVMSSAKVLEDLQRAALIDRVRNTPKIK